jgi:arabinofuranosyltransferase
MDSRPKSSQSRVPAFAWCVAAIVAVALSVLAYSIRDCFVDDAYIGFRYIDNLLAGRGFVFFAGQKPVEGATNIGWLLLLTPTAAVLGPTAAAKILGLVLLLATIAATVWLGRSLAVRMDRAADGFGLTIVPVLLLASSFEFVYFPLAGMETALLAAILLLMACVALHRPYGITLPVLGALAFLVHPEAAAVYPVFAAISWIRNPENRRNLLVGNVVLVALIIIITAIRFLYFGDFVPNTFHSKPGGWRLALENGYGFLMGRNTNIAFPITGWLAVPVLLLGYRRLRTTSAAVADMLAAVCGVGLLFAIYSPPDWTALPRYFAPYLPAALVLLWSGVVELACLLTVPAKPQAARGVLFIVALLLLLTNIFDAQTKMSQLETFPGYVLAGKNLIEPSLWMRDNLPPNATIATRRIGVLAYYSDRNVFDYTYGLTDPEVARLVGRRGERFDTPNDPDLKAVWQARAPEYFLEDAVTLNYIRRNAHGSRNRFAIHGIEYEIIKEFPIGCDAKWVLAKRRP